MSYIVHSTLQNNFLLHIPMMFLNLSKEQVWYHSKENLNLRNTSVLAWRENTTSKCQTGNKNYFWNIIFFFTVQWDPVTSSWEHRNKKNPENCLTITSLTYFSGASNWEVTTTRGRRALSSEALCSQWHGLSYMLHYVLLASGL